MQSRGHGKISPEYSWYRDRGTELCRVVWGKERTDVDAWRGNTIPINKEENTMECEN